MGGTCRRAWDAKSWARLFDHESTGGDSGDGRRGRFWRSERRQRSSVVCRSGCRIDQDARKERWRKRHRSRGSRVGSRSDYERAEAVGTREEETSTDGTDRATTERAKVDGTDRAIERAKVDKK